MNRIWSILAIATLGATLGACRDEVGATSGDVNAAIADHAAQAAAHHIKTTDASELTTGTLDSARLDPALTGAVSANTTGVASNSADIGTNTSDIGTNATNIATNAGGISTNATDIGTNATDIGTNTTDIGTNATDIATNASAISSNTSGISANTANIATNTADISTAQADISNLKTGFVRVSFTDAMAYTGTDQVSSEYAPGTNTWMRRVSSGSSCLQKSVSLPNGAVVQSVHFRVYDNNPSYNISAFLFQNDPIAELAHVSSADDTVLQTLVDTTILNATIDNATYSYFVYACGAVSGANDVMVGSARIDYVIP